MYNLDGFFKYVCTSCIPRHNSLGWSLYPNKTLNSDQSAYLLQPMLSNNKMLWENAKCVHGKNKNNACASHNRQNVI